MKKYLTLIVKGICMGAADVVPGVSGGTIAFITGIYEELIDSIKSINASSLKLLLTGKIQAFWKAINGNFLLSIFAGIGIAIVALVKIITYVLEHEPILIWAFFFGLVLASAFSVSRSIEKKSWDRFAAFLAGTLAAFYITSATPAETPSELWFIFLCGAIAICAMILPGISGSFILLLMGKYQYIMHTIKDLMAGDRIVENLTTLCTFGLGALIGIVSFSNLLSWLLKKYKDLTIAVLGGFMFGSLNKIWPWKETLEWYTNSHGEQMPLVQRNIAPNEQIVPAVLLCIFGFALVVVLERIATKNESTPKGNN